MTHLSRAIDVENYAPPLGACRQRCGKTRPQYGAIGPPLRRSPVGIWRTQTLWSYFGSVADKLAPVAAHRLDERERRDGSGIGPQNPRSDCKPHHIRQRHQRVTFLVGKAPFGADD